MSDFDDRAKLLYYAWKDQQPDLASLPRWENATMEVGARFIGYAKLEEEAREQYVQQRSYVRRGGGDPGEPWEALHDREIVNRIIRWAERPQNTHEAPVVVMSPGGTQALTAEQRTDVYRALVRQVGHLQGIEDPPVIRRLEALAELFAPQEVTVPRADLLAVLEHAMESLTEAADHQEIAAAAARLDEFVKKAG